MWPFGKNTADRVKDALAEQPRLKDLGIQVQERGGNVTLSGNVPAPAHKTLAQLVAQGINGVKSVDVSGLIAPAPTTPVHASAPVSAQSVPAPSNQPTVSMPSNDIPEAEIQEMEDRSKIAKAVVAAIRGNVELKDDPIDVLQSGKSVILRGVVDSEHELRLAEKLARETEGVSAVDVSGLRVAEGTKELVKEKDQDSGDTVYTVKAGDTLSAIAQKYYGNAQEYKKIAHYNNISNPDLIQVGQKIKIPG